MTMIHGAIPFVKLVQTF